MLTTPRRGIPYPNPDRSDRPDIPAHIYNVAIAADGSALYAQGTDAARSASAHQTSGGKLWWTTDTNLLYYDDGSTWYSVGLNPTGSITLTGTASQIAFTGESATSNVVYRSRVSGDTFDRIQILADGTIKRGSGSGSLDTSTFRSGTSLVNNVPTGGSHTWQINGSTKMTLDASGRLNLAADQLVFSGAGSVYVMNGGGGAMTAALFLVPTGAGYYFQVNGANVVTMLAGAMALHGNGVAPTLTVDADSGTNNSTLQLVGRNAGVAKIASITAAGSDGSLIYNVPSSAIQSWQLNSTTYMSLQYSSGALLTLGGNGDFSKMNIDPGSGTNQAALYLTGRNAGAAKQVSLAANTNGDLTLQPVDGQAVYLNNGSGQDTRLFFNMNGTAYWSLRSRWGSNDFRLFDVVTNFDKLVVEQGASGAFMIMHSSGNAALQVLPNGYAAGKPNFRLWASNGTTEHARINQDYFIWVANDVGLSSGGSFLSVRNAADNAYKNLVAASIQSSDGTTVMRVARHPYGNERHIESGSIALTDGGSGHSGSITFTDAYSVAPMVTLGRSATALSTSTTAISTTGATFGGSGTGTAYWMAEGRDT